MSSRVYEWENHTAELALTIEAPSEDAVFAEALEAFGRLVELEQDGEPARHEIELTGADRPRLLVDWLEELVYLADTDSFVPDRVEGLELRDDGLQAVVAGRRAHLDPLVQAATYHDLRFERAGDRWRARIVLDV